MTPQHLVIVAIILVAGYFILRRLYRAWRAREDRLQREYIIAEGARILQQKTDLAEHLAKFPEVYKAAVEACGPHAGENYVSTSLACARASFARARNNARLDETDKAFDDLLSAQSSLFHAQKMAAETASNEESQRLLSQVGN